MSERSIPQKDTQEQRSAQYADQNPRLNCHQPMGQAHSPGQAVGPQKIGNYGGPGYRDSCRGRKEKQDHRRPADSSTAV
jgi:hypothetical protein